MTKIIRIDTEGDVTLIEGSDLLARAGEEFSALTVVSCHIAPILQDYMPPVFVLALDDFGAEDMPINYKAWALYGRSPIYGTAFFAYDGDAEAPRPDLPEVLVQTITRALDTWVDEGVINYMNIPRDRPEMLTTRAEGDGDVGVDGAVADLAVANDDHPDREG